MDLGRAQGQRFAPRIRALLGELRERHTPTSWLAAGRRVQRGPARALARFLPQQCERVEGVATGAGVSCRGLHVLEAAASLRGAGFAHGGVLQLSVQLPAALRGALLTRSSVPDAGGFASVEWTCAHWSGALGGVNSEGIAALCEQDLPHGGPSLRFLVQEMLFRARDLEAGIEHLRRRAAYAGGSGSLLVCGRDAPARRLRLDDGKLRAEPLEVGALPRGFSLRVDARARELVWIDAEGTRRRARAPATPAVREGAAQ